VPSIVPTPRPDRKQPSAYWFSSRRRHLTPWPIDAHAHAVPGSRTWRHPGTGARCPGGTLAVLVADKPPRDHGHISQMSMPKPERPNMATATPSARRGPRRRRSSTPGCPSWTPSHPPQASVLPEGAVRRGSALVWRACIPDTCAASGPEPGTWKDPGPRRRSSRGSGGSEQACLPGNGGYATPAACPVSTTSWRYGLRRTCHLVTGRSHRPRSAWPNQAGYRSPQSRTAINGHIVFGSKNFRSPTRRG